MQAKKQTSTPLGASLVVLSSIVYASYGVWITLTGDFFGDFTQAVLRSLLVVILLLPIAIWRRQLSAMHWRRDAWPIVGLFVSAILISAPLFYAVKIVGVGLGIAIMYAGIVLGAFLFGRIFAGERYTKDKWLSTIFGIAGLWLVFTPSTKAFGVIALLAALVSGLASGLNMVVNRKIRYSALQTTILAWGATVIANIPLIFILGEPVPAVQLDIHWLYLLLFAVASCAGSWLLISGLKLIEAGAAGILGLLEIVFGVLFGVMFFSEQPSFVAMLGMVCIMVAATIPYGMHYRRKLE